MYCFIILCVLLVAEIAKTQDTGDSFIKLFHYNGDGALKVKSKITLDCQFRKTSGTVNIELYVIHKDNQNTILKRWNDTQVTYQTNTEGYVRYEDTVTDSGKYQCKMRQDDPDSSSTSNMYALHIWQARMKNSPANFIKDKPTTVNCSVQWVKQFNIAFTWYLDETRIHTGFHTKTTNNHDGTYNVTSSLKYTSRRQDDGKYLTCEARDGLDSTLSSTQRKMVTILTPTESPVTSSPIRTTTKRITTTDSKVTDKYKTPSTTLSSTPHAKVPTTPVKYTTPSTTLSSTPQAKEATTPEVPAFTSDFPIQDTTANSTHVDVQETPIFGLGMYILLGVIGFLIVVGLPACYCWTKRTRKRQLEKDASIRAEHAKRFSLHHGLPQRVTQPSPRSQIKPEVKPEGMVYAELEMVKEKAAGNAQPRPSAPPVIHGTENMVEYASIAWDKNVIVG